MTGPEVRSMTRAYMRLQGLMQDGLPEWTRTSFTSTLIEIEKVCEEITGTSYVSRWARSVVGPVLAASLGAAVYTRDIANVGGMLRIFGLTGSRALSAHEAWRLVHPYAHEPVLVPAAVEEISRHSGLRLKLPPDPSPVDVLEELTRQRSNVFCLEVCRWLSDYFQAHAGPGYDGQFTNLYRSLLSDLVVMNEHGDMANHSTDNFRGHFTRDEWQELLRGRVPQGRLEVRAGYMTARHFLIEYWEHGNKKKSVA